MSMTELKSLQTELNERERASQSFFDRWAEEYDQSRISSWFQYTQELTIESLDLDRDSRILDVGCGTGYATRRLASLAPLGRACGIDISAAMIEAAQQAVPPGTPGQIEFRQASSADLPYADETFTHVICTNSFHHYPEPMGVLGEFQRVLRPKGQLAIFENAPDLSWYTWAWDKALRLVGSGHVRYYPSQELGAMIKRAGFERTELRLLRNEFMKHGKLFASVQLWAASKGSAAGSTA